MQETLCGPVHDAHGKLDGGDARDGANGGSKMSCVPEEGSAKAVHTTQELQCSGPGGPGSDMPFKQKGGQRQRLLDAKRRGGVNVPNFSGNTAARCGKQPFVDTVMPGTGHAIGSKQSFLATTGTITVQNTPSNVCLTQRHMPIIDGDDECQAVGIVAARAGELVTESEGSPVFPKNAEQKTTKSASSSPT
jgi:hypothetical protein